ncbi:uncharacterized protein LOC121386281 isoform X2 [Gigantopelta aegis]|uniref:uncharacterized protein LOC121386281 isoform X2 n=1 Tax=Gigantopelta aegis TaxID=1735272 RepID=UPI001B88A669|nr:uncharacterized protein LOC121386281 isoform X2 [Gigantopelta aegis]
MASNWKLLTVSYARKIILLALLLNIDVCLGFASTTINCMKSGQDGLSTWLICTVNGTVVSGIRWIRPNVLNPESEVSESTIILIVAAVLLVIIAVPAIWFCNKRMKRQPKPEEEQTENKTQEAEDEKGQHDK